MIIAGRNFPCIGFMRAKAIGTSGKFELSIYPASPGPLMGHEPATLVEIVVDQSEIERIERFVPHLFARR